MNNCPDCGSPYRKQPTCRSAWHGLPAFVALTDSGRSRILDTAVGTEFEVDSWTEGVGGWIAHVRDSRYRGMYNPYTIWSLGVGDWSPPVVNV